MVNNYHMVCEINHAHHFRELEAMLQRHVLLFFLLSQLLLLLCLANGRPAGRKRLLRLLPPPPARRPGAPPAEAMWFKEQKLDHFSDSDKRTWSQRYFINDTLWDRSGGGPVFLMLGGEGPADPDWLTEDTEIMINAAKYKAFVIFLEHRFYGESHPTADTSLSNLVYLSSKQALRDAVYFKQYAMAMYNMTEHNKWVSFGGSYSGALSGWLRMLYPGTVSGAVATSGPVQAELNFYQYLEVAGQSLATARNGQKCVEDIHNATFILDSMLANKTQWPAVERLFNLFSPIQNQDDVANLADLLVGNVAEIVQYNMDNIPFNVFTIDDLCDVMVNVSIGTPLERYAVVNYLINFGDEINANFSEQVESMRETAWNSSSVDEGMRQWIYQTCTEFGYYQTTDSALQPFGDLITLASQLKICSAVYELSPDSVNTAVTATNKYYGGRNIPKNATNIIFPNGSIDPWHALGVLKTDKESLVAIFINGTAHCANMYPPSPTDPPGLVQARATITATIEKWL